jgi:hypothetical protein
MLLYIICFEIYSCLEITHLWGLGELLTMYFDIMACMLEVYSLYPLRLLRFHTCMLLLWILFDDVTSIS